MQLHAAVVRPGEAAAAQAAAGHAEIAAVFLHHHVRRHLRRAVQRVLALVDREILGDAVAVRRIVVVPGAPVPSTGCCWVGRHTLVGREMLERTLGAALARGIQLSTPTTRQPRWAKCTHTSEPIRPEEPVTSRVGLGMGGGRQQKAPLAKAVGGSAQVWAASQAARSAGPWTVNGQGPPQVAA
jgi:hypothetical protein